MFFFLKQNTKLNSRNATSNVRVLYLKYLRAKRSTITLVFVITDKRGKNVFPIIKYSTYKFEKA